MRNTTITLADLPLNPAIQGPLWSHGGAQMDVNVLYFDKGEGVAEHVNDALDVWLVVIQGVGEAVINGESHPLTVGTCLYIPAGASRAIRSLGDPLLYASAHPKRRGLMPEMRA